MQKKYLAVFMGMLLMVSFLPVEARGVANGLPDIAVTKLEVTPNPGEIGDEGMAIITVSYNNDGKKALSADCTLELRLDDVSVNVSNCNGLKSGESKTYNVPIMYSTAGSHNVKVVASMNRDRIGTNNIKEATLVIKELPNLKVIDFRCAGGHCPEQPIEGDPVGFQWSVQNIGAAIEGVNLTATVTMNGDVVSVITYNNRYIFNEGFDGDGVLIPGRYYKPGIYTFKLNITLDAKESSLADNSAEFIVEVVSLPPTPGLPDLTIGGTYFEWDATRPQDVIVHYIVENIGDIISPAADVGIGIDGQAYSIRNIGSIQPFSKLEDTFVVPAYLIGGSDPSPIAHTMNFNIDPGNLVEEKREDNNGWISMLCYPPGKDPWCGQLPPYQSLPDITLSYISVEQPDAGSITVNHYLKNNGPGILDRPVTLTYSTDALEKIQIIRTSIVDAILAPGEQIVVSETFSANDIPTSIFPGGYYHFWIEADPQNIIPETDENNNILVFGVCVINCYSITPTPTPTPP